MSDLLQSLAEHPEVTVSIGLGIEHCAWKTTVKWQPRSSIPTPANP